MFAFYRRLTDQLDPIGDALMPTLSRLTFAGVLLVYYWNSGMTKLGDGIFGFLAPRSGAYKQIFPKAFEATGYDTSQLSIFHWAVVTGGTIAEFVLPLLIVVGLLTRLSAIAMIGFIIVQSLTDLFGHGADLGGWFNRASGELIADQRAFWILALLILVFKGAGPLALDRFFRNAP
ncbi:MAG: DoxX family protein [Yoonia sp.]|nr:DoxX family protein [Yoonia sp.]